MFRRKRPVLEALPFTDNNAAFEYWCEFGHTKIAEKMAIPAIILDHTKASRAHQLMLREMSRGENVFNAFLTKVASDDGGFYSVGLCYDKKARLDENDFVCWVPMHHNPAFAMIVPDERTGWIGIIVARLGATLRLDSGFEILERC